MHPGASLVPFQTFMRWRGGRVVLGSAGNDGRAAAEEIARLLREGFSLIVFLDGARGSGAEGEARAAATGEGVRPAHRARALRLLPPIRRAHLGRQADAVARVAGPQALRHADPGG